MKFGIYIHIPYCLQQCTYCDFATVRFDHPVTHKDYIDIVLQEIHSRNQAVPYRKPTTLYFGGGTPSLVGPAQIDRVIQEIKKHFDLSGIREVTLEINPGTINESDLNQYLKAGITRFSVGMQTFNDRLLKIIGREHTATDTKKTLTLLKTYNVLYTLDLLFVLPHQTLSDLEQDLDEIISYGPQHLSAYCLTVPDKNPLSLNRPDDSTQVEMFYRVEEQLKGIGLTRYEVSSYAAPGKESQHNTLYWQDQPYWGIGMSAHSYFLEGPYGTRFWNPPTIAAYQKQVQSWGAAPGLPHSLPKENFEELTISQSLTDFCHTRLRTVAGLSFADLEARYGNDAAAVALRQLNRLQSRGLVETLNNQWKITHKALVLSEQVFQEMTFLASDLV